MADNARSRRTRQQVLDALADQPRSLGELVAVVGRHRNTVRRHLYQLHAERLIDLHPAVPAGEAFPTEYFTYTRTSDA